MSASNSELPAMEVTHPLEEDVLLADPPSSAPSSTPSILTTAKPDFTTDSKMESRAISMASNECTSGLSSPAEASPAKPAVTPSSLLEENLDQSPATSKIASASDSLKSPETSLISISDSPPWVSALPPSTFGCPNSEKDSPATLTFKGVTVTLENNSIWKQFSECGTEMILTKQGRRMFPYCRYRLSGLDPDRMYSLVLSIVPSGQFRYRWNSTQWEVSGPTEHQSQGLIRAFPHHYSPCRGSEWMNCLVSFYKLKLTNCFQDQDGHMILHSMHRYIPRLHIIPLLDEEVPTADKPVVMGPESITFTFPQTEFMAVTTYQNFRITQLKINHNPFAKGFREDGNNPRLNRIFPPAVKKEIQTEAMNPTEPGEQQEEVMDLSIKSPGPSPPSTNAQEAKLVLKPIMSNMSGNGDTYVSCLRGKHTLGEIMLVQKPSCVEPKKEDSTIVISMANSGRIPPRSRSKNCRSSTVNQGTSTRFRKRKRRKIKRRWTMYYGRSWKTAASAPKAAYNPSLTVPMQPELDDIEGLLFVSFTSREALEVHVKDKLANSSSSEAPVTQTEPTESKDLEEFCGVSVEENGETAEEKTAQLESLLLDDLSVLKHRQVIHPSLQEVGLKLSSLDPSTPVDLRYLGVCLPLPPSSLHGQSSTPALSPADEELPYVSRTGKTSDVTKIKGWRTKFTRSQESGSSNSEGLQRNLSAFCSNMLDEYLESEAQQISERAAAFSTHQEDAVAYQMPSKSSSYVKTLDSVLKHRNAASKVSAGANRPCPRSRKTLPYSAPDALNKAAYSDPEAAVGSRYTDISQRLPTSQSGANQGPVMGFSHSQSPAHKPAGFTKIQLKLLEMETAAFNQGLSRTHLTPERLSTALSVIMSDKCMPHEIPFQDNTVGPQCDQDFCRLGCVCQSLQQLNTTPDHCRHPECMFTHSCLETKIDREQSAQPHIRSPAGRLWKSSIFSEDLEPLYVPKVAPSVAPPKVQRTWTFCPAPPIREEDKDPVYKYLESKMTCARVREYNSLPPPIITLGSALFQQKYKPTQQKAVEVLTKQDSVAEVTDQKPVETPSGEAKAIALKAKKQIQIQSMCPWKKDSKMVLESLCERMNQNRLHLRFCVGPYYISPVTKVILKKPSGTVITYRMEIGKLEKMSDGEDETGGGEGKRDDGRIDANAESEKAEDSGNRYAVIPFPSEAISTGILRARKKPSGCKASGLIQVNDKCYNHATLLLGNMGSLHPTNRLAAHVTGRLRSQAHKKPAMQPSTNKAVPESFHGKPKNAFVPPVLDQKMAPQAKADLLRPAALSNSCSSTVQDSQKSRSVSPSAQPFVPIQQNIHSSSMYSAVSLTVSPSLKSPTFLTESGTYSFRICPPASQAGGTHNPAGVALPGGFILIQLPKPGSEGAGEQAKPPSATGTTPAENKDRVSNLSHLAREWVGFDTLSKVRTLLSSNLPEADSSGPLSKEKVLLRGSSEEDNPQQAENQQGLYFEMSSDELSSDFSDYDECDEDDEIVDIETVEWKQGEAISKMREDSLIGLKQSRDSAEDGQVKELNEMYKMNSELKGTRVRQNHSVLERQRRCEQRVLFDRLQSLLKLDSRSSRLHVLKLAVQEIKNLGKMARYLQLEKERLLQTQSFFLRKLSVLAGKPESLIKSKLEEIFERQKQREKNLKWKPFFSHLLQSKAALLQATASPSDLQPSSPPQCDVNTPSPPKLSGTAKNNLKMLMSLLQPLKRPENASNKTAGSKSMQDSQTKLVPVAVPGQASSKLDENPKASGNPVQSAMPTSLTDDSKLLDKLAHTVSATTSGFSGAKKRTIVVPAKPFAVPLIRSKTGRLILPSSMKPLSKGFYTLMVMEPKKKGEGHEASSTGNSESSDVDPSKSSEKTPCPSEQPSNPRSIYLMMNNRTSTDPDPQRSLGAADLTFLNKAKVVPSLDLQATEQKQAEAPPVLIKSSTARFCLKPVSVAQVPPSSAKPEHDSSPLLVSLSRSSSDRNQAEEEQSRTIKGNLERLTGPKQTANKPGPLKRGRGRPAKKNAASRRYSAVKRARNLDSNYYTPASSVSSLKSPSSPTSQGETSTSRPLTRGSLGKDFPSAKKRSWIDVEKELEPDLEF